MEVRMASNKKKKWVRLRHKIVRALAYGVLVPFSIIRYGLKVKRMKEGRDRQYLILYNHQTPFDQFFVGMGFKRVVYYLATEDIFSKGWISALLRYLVAPIPIKKQTTDVRAVMNCIQVAKEGGSIAIAPEGNRTYTGNLVNINSAIVPLAKKLGLPIVLYRIEGGYGVHPRWSDVVRKGGMCAYVARVIEPEEYAAMSNDELYNAILEGLNVNEDALTGPYKHKKNAEFLERAIYYCPWCGFSALESNLDVIECKRCGRKVRHLDTKQLVGVDCDFPYTTVSEWYDAQCAFVNKLDPLASTDEPLFRDTASVQEVIVYKKKVMLAEKADIALYSDKMVIGESVLPFDEISSFAVLGRNKLNLYYNKKVYQIKGGKRFNALKYLNLFHRYNNVRKGEENVEFLGL